MPDLQNTRYIKVLIDKFNLKSAKLLSNINLTAIGKFKVDAVIILWRRFSSTLLRSLVAIL